MSDQDHSVRDKIVLAAINQIEKKGIQALTIRGIANEAGVNVAAINYYFGSKEKLVEQALKTTLENAFEDWEALLRENRGNIRDTLFTIFSEIIDGALSWPGITKAHLYDPLINNRYDNHFVQRLNGFMKELLSTIETDPESEKQMKFSLIQMVSSVMFVGLLPDLFQGFAGVRFTDPAARKAYVRHLMGQYF